MSTRFHHSFLRLVLLSALALPMLHGLEFTRKVQVAPHERTSLRTRKLERTLLFCERQPYVPYSNFMHYYIDRPLYEDVSLRKAREPQRAGFLRDVEIGGQSGMDGFGSIAYYGLHLSHLQMLKDAQVKNHSQMIVLCPGAVDSDYDAIRDMVVAAGKSPYTTRIRGRVACWSYGNGQTDRLERLIGRLKKEKDAPPLFVFGELPFIKVYNAYHACRKKGQTVPENVLQQFRKDLRHALDVFDGLDMRITERDRSHLGAFGYRTVEDPVYTKYLLPITLEVLREKPYRQKLLGAYVHQAYVNHFAGWTHDEYGTEMVRCEMEAALRFDPDLIMLFEWNEANENTSFQPTVANGRSMERVLNYYKALLNGQPQKPRPGDNPNVPNLIVSSRQALRLGEPCHVELLHVPDGENLTCKARLRLLGTHGKTLGDFPLETMPGNRMTAFSYEVPSELFADQLFLQLELTTDFKGRTQTWRQFDPIRLDTTTQTNYKYTRHCLRDMLPAEQTDFTVTREPDGGYKLTGSLKAGEDLSTLEILDCGEEVAAAGEEPAFDRSRFALFRGVFTSMKTNRARKGEIRVEGSADWSVRAAENAWACFFNGVRKGDAYVNSVSFESCRGTFLLSVPKKDLSQAVLKIRYDGACDFTFPLQRLAELGRMAKVSPQHVRLEMERQDVLGDYPMPLNRPAASLTAIRRSAHACPVYQLRAVSRSGKIYRSCSVAPMPPMGPRQPLEVFSETAGKPVTVSVHASRVPKLAYNFDSKYGAWLANDSDHRYDAMLGGGWVYAYSMRDAGAVPEDFITSTPEWVSDGDGRRCLSFDGHGSYLVLPPETVPRSAVFTFECEIKPAHVGNQTLLRCVSAGELSGLQLILEDGCLKGVYMGVNHVPRAFPTKLPLKAGEWNAIRVEKDFERTVFTVNGKTVSYGYGRRGAFFRAAVFGGYVAPGPEIPSGIRPFQGLLRKLSIIHDRLR